MVKRIAYLILLLLLLADIHYSFKQYYTQVLDGDIAACLVPANDIQPILDDPLGIHAILNNETYANTNRFFCQWTLKEYLTATPLFLQKFVDPIESVYLSSAIAKTLIQVVLIILLAMAITGTKNVFKLEFIFAAVLITPFFQTNGYRDYIGIVDCSITYVFFYAIPCAFLFLYFLPILQQFYHERKSKYQLLIKILWIPLAFGVCLGGPLNPGVVLVFSLLIGFYYLKNGIANSTSKNIINKIMDAIRMVPKDYWFYLSPVCLLSLYSLFLGSYNSLTIESQIPLSEMYLRIPQGIFNILTQKLAFPILLGMLILNSLLISYKFSSPEGKKIVTIFKWIGVFALCYILLLPLGGYREYRHYIVRYDTIMPITLALLFVYGISTLYLIKNMGPGLRFVYLPIVVAVWLVFTLADKPWYNINGCERAALEEIAASKESVVELNHDCTIVAWGKFKVPEESELNARLFVIWGITKEKKLYYQKENPQ
jgi:hypothetical protein